MAQRPPLLTVALLVSRAPAHGGRAWKETRSDFYNARTAQYNGLLP